MTSGHRSFPVETGIVVLADDGAVAAVRPPDGRPMLLEETTGLHDRRVWTLYIAGERRIAPRLEILPSDI